MPAVGTVRTQMDDSDWLFNCCCISPCTARSLVRKNYAIEVSVTYHHRHFLPRNCRDRSLHVRKCFLLVCFLVCFLVWETRGAGEARRTATHGKKKSQMRHGSKNVSVTLLNKSACSKNCSCQSERGICRNSSCLKYDGRGKVEPTYLSDGNTVPELNESLMCGFYDINERAWIRRCLRDCSCKYQPRTCRGLLGCL